MYQYKSDHNAVLESSEPANSWAVALCGKINGGLAVVGQTVYVDGFDHYLYAINARDGAIAWKTNLGGIAMATPIVDDGIVDVGTGTNMVLYDTPTAVLWGRPGGDNVFGIDALTGDVVWKYHKVGEEMPSPALVNGEGTAPAVVFAGGNGHVRSLDLKSGKPRWERYMNGVATMSSTAIKDGYLFGIQNFSVNYLFANVNNPYRLSHATWTWAMRSSDGQLAWRAPYGNSDCSPTVADGRVFLSASKFVHPITSGDSTSYTRVYALDMRRGGLLWHYDSGSGSRDSTGTNEDAIAGMYHGGVFYESLPFARRLAAFDANSGRLLWSVPTGHPVKMSAVTQGLYVSFGDTGGAFYTVLRSTGKLVSKTQFPSFFSASSPVIVGATLYVASDTRVFAIPVDELVRGTYVSVQVAK